MAALVQQLAQRLLEKYPERAARVIESAEIREGVGVLSRCSAASGAGVISSLPLHRAADLLARLDGPRGIEVLECLELDVAARLVRRIPQDIRERLLAIANPRRSRALRGLIRFPENSAGAVMDPDVLALPEDLSAREALERLREGEGQASYNVYVVDRDQLLVGALNLRELFLAEPARRLSDLMVRDPLRVTAESGIADLISHPGWKRVHSLPVVDAQGAYLGAVRYRTLRSLEEDLKSPTPKDADPARAFGELLATAAGGVLDALGGTSARSGDGA